MEPILDKTANNAYTVFPIRYPALWKFYKQHISTFWTVEEVKLTDDLVDWNSRLNDNERFFIKNVLAFFAASDGIVNENLVVNFYNEVQIAEARQFYSVQMMIEAVHSEQYSLLIDTYVSSTDEKNALFNAIETIPAIKRKADWAIQWIQEGSSLQQFIPDEYMNSYRSLLKSDEYGESPFKTDRLDDECKRSLDYLVRERPNFAQRLLAFVCVEGIFFSGSFCAIYWLKSRGLMPGLSTANQFISRDENLHAEFAIELYNHLENKLDETTVHAIFQEAVDIEREFITESLPVSLIGMNCGLMSQYIEMVADRWLVLLGYSKIYNSQNPFPFMEMISLNEKVNFFENVVTNYQRANVGTTEEDRKIQFDSDDF